MLIKDKNDESGAVHLAGIVTQRDLASRWHISAKKLEADRLKGTGCPFIKIGSAVRYRVSDILAYEDANLRHSTSDKGGADV